MHPLEAFPWVASMSELKCFLGVFCGSLCAIRAIINPLDIVEYIQMECLDMMTCPSDVDLPYSSRKEGHHFQTNDSTS